MSGRLAKAGDVYRYGRRDALLYARSSAAARKRMRRAWFFSGSRHFAPLVAVRWPSGTFLLPTHDQVVGRHSFTTAPFGLEDLEAVEGLLAHSLGRPFRPVRGRTVVEIGANIGTTTVPLLTVLGASRVVAFEPAPDNALLLRANVVLNDVADRVDVHAVALSDRTGTADFEMSPRNTGDYRIRAREPAANLQGEDKFAVVQVPTDTFDHVAAATGLDLSDVALVWLDVQGHEAQVLLGATSLLAHDVPVLTEYWPYGLARAGGLDDFERLVVERYDTFYDMEASLLRPAADITALREIYAEHYAYTNLVLVPRA